MEIALATHNSHHELMLVNFLENKEKTINVHVYSTANRRINQVIFLMPLISYLKMPRFLRRNNCPTTESLITQLKQFSTTSH